MLVQSGLPQRMPVAGRSEASQGHGAVQGQHNFVHAVSDLLISCCVCQHSCSGNHTNRHVHMTLIILWYICIPSLSLLHTHTHTHTQSPRGKVRCIAESCRVLISLLQYAKVGSPPGADDLFPVLVYVLIKANPPGLLSTTQYVKNFLEDSLKGEENYWWVQFSTAVEFTKTLE